MWGRNAAQLSIAAGDTRYVRETLAARYAGGVYVHWNFWCNVSDETQRRFCRQTLASYPSHIVVEYRERDYRYALYKLDLPPGS